MHEADSTTENDSTAADHAEVEPSAEPDVSAADSTANGEAEAEVAQEPETIDPAQALLSAQSQAAANYEQFLRARAELDNVQKRQQRELGERAKYAAEPLARDLLGALDDLTRALAHHDETAAASPESQAVAEGVRLVLANLEATLQKHGVVRVESAGCTFDPSVHEAIAMVPSADAEPGSVLEEHRAGYQLHDRLLRPALVVVVASS